MCEDYPACGHGPPPLGDWTGPIGWGCPDENGRYCCARCYQRMPKGYRSAICALCIAKREEWEDDDDGY